jgi:HTH-type transcriptional regulator, sugar sensing transcriptional regulator
LSKESSSSLQDIESSLKENFKLSSYEAKAYISLFRLGGQSTKQLSSSAGIPLPRVYDTLESLMAKGFVMKKEDNFLAIPPKQALKGRVRQFEIQFSEDQKRRADAEARLVDLLQRHAGGEDGDSTSSEISVLNGFNTIANKFSELLESSTDVILVAKRSVEAKEFFIPILLEYSRNQSVKRRIRIIAPKNVRISKDDVEQAREANAQIRKSDNIIFDMMITDQNDVLIGVPDPLSEEINHAIAIWVRNASFARSTRNSIEEMWDSAERV